VAPGHHAMGFFVFSNVAMVALYAQCVHKLHCVLIIDYDVQHGNGIHDAFYNDLNIFFMSTHQVLLSFSLCFLLQQTIVHVCLSFFGLKNMNKYDIYILLKKQLFINGRAKQHRAQMLFICTIDLKKVK
jgi:hypothetical protein